MIMNRQKTRPYVPLFTYTAVTTLIVAMVCSVLAVVVGGHVFCLDTNCLLGYLSPQVSFLALEHPLARPLIPTHPLNQHNLLYQQTNSHSGSQKHCRIVPLAWPYSCASTTVSNFSPRCFFLLLPWSILRVPVS